MTIPMSRGPVAGALAAVLLVATSFAGAQDLFIRGGHVITCAGPEMPEAHVLIRGGRIEAAGPDVVAPEGVRVIDAYGRYVMPAFVVAETSQGIRTPNEIVPVTPFVSVTDSLDPTLPFIEDCFRDGHYTVHILPGDRTAIGGTGAIIRPYGLNVLDMVLAPDSAMKISLIPPGGSRAAHLSNLRRALEDGQRYLEGKRRDAPSQPQTGSTVLDLMALGVDRRQHSLARLLEGDLIAFVTCGTAGDCMQALRLAEEFKIKVQLVCGPGTWRAAEWLGKQGVSVILQGDLEMEESDPDTGKNILRVIPKIYKDAGVRFALTPVPGHLGRRYMWYQAATLLRYGFTREEALAAATSIPAELIGMQDRKGDLSPGKDADVLIMTADPLTGLAWVDKGIMAGEVAYDRARDPRLKEVLGSDHK